MKQRMSYLIKSTRLTNTQITKLKENIQINKSRKEKWDKKETKQIQGIMRPYFNNLHSNKLENQHEVDNFLNTCYVTNLN